MGVPEAVLEKVGSMPDVSAMSKDDLAALCKSLYDRSCIVFGEKFDEEYQVKKRDMEIQPGDGDQRVTWNIQDSQVEEGQQVQGYGRRTRINYPNKIFEIKNDNKKILEYLS